MNSFLEISEVVVQGGGTVVIEMSVNDFHALQNAVDQHKKKLVAQQRNYQKKKLEALRGKYPEPEYTDEELTKKIGTKEQLRCHVPRVKVLSTTPAPIA